ncbi:SpoIIIAC/SpoIIIAD family protein [Hominifimenecus sp. rT4P-3]|uniref:SpoIIIAC/SpoIIIAD family protein n=1 Tax=Hominifimenecus sp. rT4P-3 TaxID=3242979 RepID=UPI003DA3FDEC
MEIMTVALLGMLIVLAAIPLKALKPEYSMLLSLAGTLLIFFYCLGKVSGILDLIGRIQEYLTINEVYVTTLLKIIGVTYVAEFAGNICRDAGYQAVAVQIEIFGKLTVLAISMPILLALLDVLDTFLS